jgi:hypothetical protein
MSSRSAFIAALCADSPAADRAEKLSLYGWLIGSWQMEATVCRADGTRHSGQGEIHFAWTLEGRALRRQNLPVGSRIPGDSRLNLNRCCGENHV